MSVDPKELETRIQEVFELNRESIELSESGNIQELGPPACEKSIREVEETLGFSLPPSYRTFLSLHDGWTDFAGDLRFLSIAEIGRGECAEEVQALKKRARNWGETPPEGLIIGVDLHTAGCYVIDMAKVNEQGEAPVVYWEFEEISRDEDFATMLVGVAKALRTLIRYELRNKRRKINRVAAE
jgi:hypothetical protein